MLDPGLMDPLRRFARCCRSCVAPRPGSNALPLLELRSSDETVSVDGEDMEAMYRAGLLIAEPDEEERIIEDTEEYGGIEANYLWRLSPAGHTALATGSPGGSSSVARAVAREADVMDAECSEQVDCERCQGNGEIVTDWGRYLRPHDNDEGDEAVASCPDCNGEGRITAT